MMDFEREIAELTRRVHELIYMLVSMYHSHPEICPHDWDLLYREGDVSYYHCPWCGEDKKEEK